MRRDEKEITDKSEIEEVLKRAIVCRLGMSDGHIPYIVPLCFGYQDDILYFHGAPEGKKIDILKKNHNVCVEFDIGAEIIKKEKACGWSMKFKSVIGFGRAFLVDDIHEKMMALKLIMGQYTDQLYDIDDNFLRATAVIRVEVDKMTGKRSGF